MFVQLEVQLMFLVQQLDRRGLMLELLEGARTSAGAATRCMCVHGLPAKLPLEKRRGLCHHLRGQDDGEVLEAPLGALGVCSHGARLAVTIQRLHAPEVH